MEIQFLNTSDWGIKKSQFTSVSGRLDGEVPKAAKTDGVLNVVFVNDAYIKSLNKAYRKKNEATDVLSFSHLKSPDFKETNLIGEIYISVPTAKRQAKEAKLSFQSELNKLFVHGFLHIFGYDHENNKGYKVMSAIEKRILS